MGTGVSFKPSSPHSLSFRTRACALKTKSYLSLPINLTAPWLSPRPISNGPLHASRHFHFHPIYLIISEGSYFPEGNGKSHLEASFTLRCFQRLSRPYIATQRCSWRNNWYTSGMSTKVLISVVFPAPFSPSRPYTPSFNVAVTFFSAYFFLYCFDTLSNVISMLFLPV